MNKELIAEVLATDEISSSGNSCNFIDLGNGHGIKCFMNLDSRETAYTVQEFFAGKDMAPKVGDRFNIVDYNGDTWYCYPTEVAETLVEYGIDNSQAFSDSHADNYDDYGDLMGDWTEENSLLERDKRDAWLIEAENITGIEYQDDHVGNWGWITRKGREILVVIDFDTCYKVFNKLNRGDFK